MMPFAIKMKCTATPVQQLRPYAHLLTQKKAMLKGTSNQPTKNVVKKKIETRLLPWFAVTARDLPWRRNRTPYRVWVAEVMLQQTRVDSVISYYRHWMNAFPSWRSLAEAPQSEVLKLWEGLGYYSRARNLHTASKIIMSKYNGDVSKIWKKDIQGLKKSLTYFPGIGVYTAAAIASIAFNEDVAVVDGNVVRVLSRLFAYGGETYIAAGKKKMQAWADDLLVKGRADEFNEAMMELGALLCLPKNPVCSKCPMCSVCAAFAKGATEKYPVMKKKKTLPHLVVGAAVTINRKGEVLIAQRRQTDMLGGLWEFPGGKLKPNETIKECIARELKEEMGLNIVVGDFLLTIRHTYSHFTMTLHTYWAKITSGRPHRIECADYAWVKIQDLRNFAYSKADLYIVEKLRVAYNGNVLDQS